jgi:hypothetical protein
MRICGEEHGLSNAEEVERIANFVAKGRVGGVINS